MIENNKAKEKIEVINVCGDFEIVMAKRPWLKVMSSKGVSKFYAVSIHLCPHCDGFIYMCTCPDFQLGRPRRGIDPIKDPCKHIKRVDYFKDTIEKQLRLLANVGGF